MQLIRSLAISGARGPDDVPISSGTATFYEPGTLTPAVVWKDTDGAEAWPQPIALDETGKAEVWADGQRRMIVKDADGVTILDADPANTDRDKQIEIVHAGWPNTADLSALVAALYATLGGNDGNYRPDPAATDMLLKAFLSGLCISVKNFGAKGDGLEDDYNAFVAAYTAVKQHAILGGLATLFIPAGVYRMRQEFPINDPAIRVLGSGRDATFLEFFGADSNGIVATVAEGLVMSDFTVKFDGGSGGIGIDLKAAIRHRLERVRVQQDAALGFALGCRVFAGDADCRSITFEDCDLEAPVDAVTRALAFVSNDSGFDTFDIRVLGGTLKSGGTQADIEDTLDGFGFEFDGVALFDGADPSKGIHAGGIEGCSIHACDFLGRNGAAADIEVSASAHETRTWANKYSVGGLTDLHGVTDLGRNNIFGDVSHNPVGNRGPFIDLGTLADNLVHTQDIDLDKGNYWRIKGSWGGGNTAEVNLSLPTSSFQLKAGQELTLDCQVGVGAPTAPGGFQLSSAWASGGEGQGDILVTPQDGSFGYINDNNIGAEAPASTIPNGNKNFFNTAANTHTIITLVYDGSFWRAKSRKTSKQ